VLREDLAQVLHAVVIGNTLTVCIAGAMQTIDCTQSGATCQAGAMGSGSFCGFGS
jgi:hypothetical protein